MDTTSQVSEHQRFYEWFQGFWAEPSGAAVASKFRPDAQIHMTGAGTLTGAEYVGWMDGLLKDQPDLEVTPMDYAGSGDLIYIHWRATSTINGAKRAWYGVDRFRVEDGMVVEEHVIFDSALLQAAPPGTPGTPEDLK